MGFVNRADGAADAAWLTQGRYTIDVAGEQVRAIVHLRAPYDSRSERVKG